MTRAKSSLTMRRSLAYPMMAALLVLLFAVASPGAPRAASPPAAPGGLTAIALTGQVSLAWRPSTGATTYQLYRGTSAGSITTLVTPGGYTGTSYTNTGLTNGTTYYYAVRATNADGQSVTSQIAQVRPVARSCSTGNAIRIENCFAGTTAWKSTDAVPSYPDGIEGFLSAPSVNAGGSVDLKVTTDWDTPYRVEIYRTGYYGGTQGRLISVIPSRMGDVGFCSTDLSGTGLIDCSAWDTTATISTTSSWPSGVYLLKLVRTDTGAHSEVPLVVRNDGSSSSILYDVPTNTYAAYNAWYGKSLYGFSSDPPKTVSGQNRAVQVSFDRPFSQPPSPSTAHDYYTRTDLATVSWLEQQGYDTTYVASLDVHTTGAQLRNHRVFISGSHDEYWTQEMFDAAIAARNAGTSLVFMGANAAYWKVRYIASPISGIANRVMVAYKSVDGSPVDPSGISTTTWRDPAGPNRPENELIGQMYIGDNASMNYPLTVSASQGANRIWRHTSVFDQAPGATMSIGTSLVGWEWDARAANGREPAGVQTVASSPVEGNLVQASGAAYTYGSATATTTVYRAASGAVVFATGTNNWWRGLALNVHGQGEPDVRIQQATVNVLSDGGAQPTTASATLAVDPTGAPVVSTLTPASNATGVALSTTVKVKLDREIDPTTVDASDLTLTDPSNAAVPGTVTLDSARTSLVFTPASVLDPTVTYRARLETGFKSWSGAALAAPVTWSFTTGPGAPPTVVSRTPASNASGTPTDTTVTAKFDRAMNAATVNSSTFTLQPAAGGAAVAAAVSYNSTTRTATLTPTARLVPQTQYTATVTVGAEATDGIALATPSTWTFATGSNLQVAGTFPAIGATGVSPLAAIRVAFSRTVDAASVTAAAFTLKTSGGQTVTTSASFDPITQTATFTPTAALALSTAYTATVGGSIHAADGAPLDVTSWGFTTADSTPPPPAATSMSPANGATAVPSGIVVRANFDRSLDPATVTQQSVTLRTSGGTPIAATVSYSDTSRQISLTPLAELSPNATYTAEISTAVRSVTGAPLAATLTWSFTIADCPCTLMGNLQPTWTGIPVRDGRSDPNATYELGTKIRVTETTTLVALRFWKEPGETGSHIGRVWSAATGTQLGSVTYQNESASGWQRQALATPLTLVPGTTYVVSVGLNRVYAKTVNGLSSAMTRGPLTSVADGNNGAFNTTAGQYPADSWLSSNYFVDGVVTRPNVPTPAPTVTNQTPAAGSTAISTGTTVRATFSIPLDPGSVNTSSVTLVDQDGSLVSGQTSYDDVSRTVTFTPSAALSPGVAYTAHLTQGITSDAGIALAAPVAWSFSTLASTPVVTSVSPVDQAGDVAADSVVTARFSVGMSAATINANTFTLETGSGTAVPASVSYDSTTRVATLKPSQNLVGGTGYTARLSTAIRSSNDLALAQPVSWSFTVFDCPCSLFSGAGQPTWTGIDTSNGRTGGPYSLEMGLKVRVTSPVSLRAVRFFKSPGETGTHVARLWSATGQPLGTATFSGETASGWQSASLAAPISLTPGQVYVVSVGINSLFVQTSGMLSNEIVSGPLRSVADGANGVWADNGGDFPTNSWGGSSYWIDPVVG